MKNTLKINHENRTLVMDRTFAKTFRMLGRSFSSIIMLDFSIIDVISAQFSLRAIVLYVNINK